MNWKLILKGLLYTLVIVVLLYFVIALFLPKTYNVTKEYTIKAPVDTVYKYVSDLKEWEKWSPWQRMDSAALYTYSENTTGVGAWQSWTSPNKKGVGTGKLTFDNIIVNQEVSYILEFMEPFQSSSQGGFYLEGDSNETKIQWFDRGQCKYPTGRYMGIMMESYMGPDFMRGLSNLDSVCMKALDPNYGVGNAPTEVLNN